VTSTTRKNIACLAKKAVVVEGDEAPGTTSLDKGLSLRGVPFTSTLIWSVPAMIGVYAAE
jgi:hypothetical protein